MKITLLVTQLLVVTAGLAQINWSVRDIHPPVFDQNIGQFDDSVLFHAKLGQVHYYFTQTGYTASYLERYSPEEEKERFEKLEHKEPVSERKQHHWSFRFEECSTQSKITASEKQDYTFNYPRGEETYLASAFKKITYENIYPNIDIEFSLSGQDSLKYNIIVHPGGDLNLVKIRIPESGRIDLGRSMSMINMSNDAFEFRESIPYSYLQESSTPVSVLYKIEKNLIQFMVPEDHTDPSQTLIVDPWIVLISPFTTGTDFFKVDYDDAGNVWVMGELGAEIAKFNSSGALQWVYVSSTFSSMHGDFVIRHSTSEAFVTTEFGILLVSLTPAGVLNNTFSGVLSPAGEIWRLEFDEVNDQVLYGLGGGFFGDYYLGVSPPDLSSINCISVLPALGNAVEDVVWTEIDPDGSKFYSLSSTAGGATGVPYGNHVVVSNLPGFTGAYNFPTYHNFTEVGNADYANYFGGFFVPNSFQGIAVGSTFLYTYDGHQLKKYNKTTGVLQDSLITADTVFTCSGIALDDCGNVYIGTTDSVAAYSPNLDYLGGFDANHVVIDVRIDGSKLWACGEDFLAEFDLSSFSSSLSLSSTPDDCSACDGTATAVVSVCPGYVLDEITWSPGGANTLTASGLCDGWYVATAICINSSLGDTITLIDSVQVFDTGGSIVVTQASTNEICDGQNNGTITLNATSGDAPFNYDIGTASNSTGLFTNLASGPYNVTVTDANGCSTNFEIVIEGGNELDLGVTVQEENCGLNDGGLIAEASSGSAPYTYLLGTLSNTTGVFTNLNSGVYPLLVTDAAGCTYSLNVTIPGSGDLNLSLVNQNDPTCFGFSDGSITLNLSGGTAPVNLTWSPPNPVPGSVFNNLPAGSYTATATDATGCTESITIVLNQPPAIEADLIITPPGCYGSSGGIVVVDSVYNAQGNQNAISYFWNPNPAGIGGIGADSSYQMPAGDYVLIINDELGCSQQIPFTLTQPDPLTFVELGHSPAYCRTFGYQSGQGVVYAAAAGGTPDYTYLWQNLSTGATSNNTTWGGLNPGAYQISVTDDAGCVLTQIVQVDSLNPVADFSVSSDQLNANLEGTAVVCVEFTNQSLYFVNEGNPDADTVFWWNLNTPTAPWELTTDYHQTFDTCYTTGGIYEVCLVVMNLNNCIDTSCQLITVFNPLDFTPVNIFTPQGDGANDEFTFKHLAEGVKTFHCIIVNRWGIKVAEFNNIDDGWDGKDQGGKLCTNGVYFYVYSGEAENGTPFEGQGTIQIVGVSE